MNKIYTGKQTKFWYKCYNSYKTHLIYGNYIQSYTGGFDSQRFNDLADMTVRAKQEKKKKNLDLFMSQNWEFKSGNIGRPSKLLDCYRPEMWNVFESLLSENNKK